MESYTRHKSKLELAMINHEARLKNACQQRPTSEVFVSHEFFLFQWVETSRACFSNVRSGLNSHYFHIIGDKLINPIVGIYILIIRIPVIKGWRSPIPNDQGVEEHPIAQNAVFPIRIRGLEIEFSFRVPG